MSAIAEFFVRNFLQKIMPSNQDCELKKVVWLGIIIEINTLCFFKVNLSG
jgi:hypothetical protein